MQSRKSELLNFIDHLAPTSKVGIYYVDKELNIKHYSIYSYDGLDVLHNKLNSFDEDLDDKLIRIITWAESETDDYLLGIYEGLTVESSDCRVES